MATSGTKLSSIAGGTLSSGHVQGLRSLLTVVGAAATAGRRTAATSTLLTFAGTRGSDDDRQGTAVADIAHRSSIRRRMTSRVRVGVLHRCTFILEDPRCSRCDDDEVQEDCMENHPEADEDCRPELEFLRRDGKAEVQHKVVTVSAIQGSADCNAMLVLTNLQAS